MKRFMLFAAVAALFCLCTEIRAASLFGKVIDVSSGDVITIYNLNRSVRIKLIGVDAPEMDQAFGDVAKKHLADLVYDKSVLVEYSGIAADNNVAGRVLLNNADIGAQMIRDGAAWFDPTSLSRLSATDREVYKQSEQAARSERRGLWQAESPVAPWEFVRARFLRTHPQASLNSNAPAEKSKGVRRKTELTNLDLAKSGTLAVAPGPPASGAPLASTNEDAFAWAENVPTKGPWRQFRPAGQDFSALVPENGKQLDTQVPFAGEMGDVTVYLGRDGLSTYLVQWVKGEWFGENDRAALKDAIMYFMTGVKQGFGRHGANVSSCGATNQKSISVSELAGVEFELTSCPLRGRARIVTRVVDSQRQMYVLAAIYVDEDENIPRFLNSLTIDPKSNPRRR